MAIPADSGVFANNPRATVSQLAAKPTSTMTPITASQSRKLAAGRNPSANATPMMAAMAIKLVSMLAMTWALSTALREMSITLNRLMMPFVMSEFTASAVALSP